MAPLADAVTAPGSAIDDAITVPDTRSLATAPSTASAVEVVAAAPASPPSKRGWIVGVAVAATVVMSIWAWRSAGSRAAIELVAPLAPAASPEAAPAAVVAERRVEAAAASAFTSDVWQAVARRDYAAAARLLRGRPDLAAGLLGELASAARTAATDARRAADARGRAVHDTGDYRTGLDALARARRSDAAGPTLDGLAATWEAIDAFGRATPQLAAAPRPAASRCRRIAGRRPRRRVARAAAPAGTRRRHIPAPAPDRPLPDPPRPPVVTVPDASLVPERPVEPPAPAPPAAPSKGAPTAEESVRAALAAYEAAYDAHDVAALRQIFPALSADQAQALTHTFADAVSYRLDLRVLDVTVGPSAAAATCVVTHSLVPKVGSPSRTTQTSTFELGPAGNGWVITRIVAPALTGARGRRSQKPPLSETKVDADDRRHAVAQAGIGNRHEQAGGDEQAAPRTEAKRHRPELTG